MSHQFDVHGLTLLIDCDVVEIVAALSARLRLFQSSDTSDPDITVVVHEVPPGDDHRLHRPDGNARSIYNLSGGDISYVVGQDMLFLDFGPYLRATCDISRGILNISAYSPASRLAWLISHLLFSISLVEIMKRRGLYSIHAAGLALHGQGVILAGTSGVGKSTLAIALLRAGFQYLGDDTLFLAPAAGGLRVLAFPDELDVTRHTAELFPELGHLRATPMPSHFPKYPVWPEQVFDLALAWECRPSILILPSITEAEVSVITPLTPDQALIELAPNVLLTDAPSAQAHLESLATLVRMSACFRLATGRNLDIVPGLIGSLVERVARGSPGHTIRRHA